MDLTSNEDLTDLQIRLIYYVKSYLQVWWISDLCDAEGTMIESKLYYSEKCCKVNFNKVEIKVRKDGYGDETNKNADGEKNDESNEEAIRNRSSKFYFSNCEEVNQGGF